jgi:hypothetical protein
MLMATVIVLLKESLFEKSDILLLPLELKTLMDSFFRERRERVKSQKMEKLVTMMRM